ncbi:MAG: hypothetical protein IKX84_08760 [Clostridia bacterium]|nr:hypothetical protein [Clostridia bacterium]
MACFMLGRDASNLSQVRAPHTLRLRLESAFDQAFRSASGRLIRRCVREGEASVRRLDAEWKGLSAGEAAEILYYMSLPACFIRYPDPLSGRTRTAEFCVLSREAAVRCAEKPEETSVDISISAVEV